MGEGAAQLRVRGGVGVGGDRGARGVGGGDEAVGRDEWVDLGGGLVGGQEYVDVRRGAAPRGRRRGELDRMQAI